MTHNSFYVFADSHALGSCKSANTDLTYAIVAFAGSVTR